MIIYYHTLNNVSLTKSPIKFKPEKVDKSKKPLKRKKEKKRGYFK